MLWQRTLRVKRDRPVFGSGLLGEARVLWFLAQLGQRPAPQPRTGRCPLIRYSDPGPRRNRPPRRRQGRIARPTSFAIESVPAGCVRAARRPQDLRRNFAGLATPSNASRNLRTRPPVPRTRPPRGGHPAQSSNGDYNGCRLQWCAYLGKFGIVTSYYTLCLSKYKNAL